MVTKDKNEKAIENSEKFIEEVQSLIRLADGKAHTLFVVLGIVLSAVFAFVGDFTWFENIVKSVFVILFLVSAVANIVVLLFAVIKPRIGKTEFPNLLNFNCVAKMDKREYIEKYSGESKKLNQFAEENYNVASILARKNRWLNVCIYILCANIAFMVLIFIL